MHTKKFVKFFFIFLLILLTIYFTYSKYYRNDKTSVVDEVTEDITYNSNIIKDVEYTTKDKDGNEYVVKAKEGEIDFSNPNIIFLKKVYAVVKLTTSEKVIIISDFGKYNSINYDTIFSKNVIIDYLDNKITGEYLDFSLEKNLMVISKNVTYSNLENVLKADVIETNIKTRDTKIFMYEQEKKVNIKNNN